jgi:hypothetical protein
MNDARVYQLIHAAQDAARNIHKLNWGGCAWFATYLGEALARKGVHVMVIGTTRDTSVDIDAARECKRGCDIYAWERAGGAAFHHVAIEIVMPESGELLFVDSEEIADAGPSFKGKHVARGRYTLAECRGFAHYRDGWNRSFDRAQLPKLRRGIKRAFGIIV